MIAIYHFSIVPPQLDRVLTLPVSQNATSHQNVVLPGFVERMQLLAMFFLAKFE